MLTPDQRQDLEKAILGYFHTNNYNKTLT